MCTYSYYIYNSLQNHFCQSYPINNSHTGATKINTRNKKFDLSFRCVTNVIFILFKFINYIVRKTNCLYVYCVRCTALNDIHIQIISQSFVNIYA